jgi:hypothetical protein
MNNLEKAVLEELVWTYEFDTITKFRLNPHIGMYDNEETELEKTLFIEQCVPWVKLSYSKKWNETMVEIMEPPPEEIRAEFLKEWLEKAYEENSNIRARLIQLANEI